MTIIRSDNSKLKKIALGLLIYTILVILWGAWVRISHSGNGCGDTWPLCDGQLIPKATHQKTWIEYAHRLMSGAYGILVVYFWILARKTLAKKSLALSTAFFTLIFMISEALLGAKLVIFGLVSNNDTPYRAFVMALHQVNSLLLTGAITLCWLSINSTQLSTKLFKPIKWQPIAIIVLAITGAWASLSTTLFPSESLISGLLNDVSSSAHYLIRLRIIHPILALSLGSIMIALFWRSSLDETNSLELRNASQQTAFGLLAALAFGVSTLLALSPTWMKLGHLAIAHVIWILVLRWMFIFSKSKQKAR